MKKITTTPEILQYQAHNRSYSMLIRTSSFSTMGIGRKTSGVMMITITLHQLLSSLDTGCPQQPLR